MATLLSTANNTLSSVRSSCDRCRLYKLKCNVPNKSDDPVPCERCRRAKVSCVFGRRRRASRTRDDKTNKKNKHASTPCIPTTLSTTTITTMNPFQNDLIVNQNSEIGGISDWNAYFWDANQSDTCPLVMEPSSQIDPISCGFSPVRSPVLQNQFLQSTSTREIQPTDGRSIMDSSSGPGPRLVTLIANMQKCLQMLEEGPWRYNSTSAQSLDDYPIGQVLHLSQEFGELAAPVLISPCTESSVTPRNGRDIISPLLVLTGYLLLVRVYGIVLGHFHVHSNRIPASSLNWDASSSLYISGAETVPSLHLNPTLRLSDLTCASTAPVSGNLGRIYTAVSMLIDALNNVEEQLGQGGAVEHDFVLAMLTQKAVLGASELLRSYSGLDGRMHSVKKDLREMIIGKL